MLYEECLIDSCIFGYERGEPVPFILWPVGVKVLKIPNEVTLIQNDNYKTLNIPSGARFFSLGDSVKISTVFTQNVINVMQRHQTLPSPVGLKII